MQVFQRHVTWVRTTALFGRGIHAFGFGHIGKILAFFQIRYHCFGIGFAGHKNFRQFHFVSAFVTGFVFIVKLLHIGFAHRILADHVVHIGIAQQIALVSGKLLFEIGLLVSTLLLGRCSGFFQSIFVSRRLFQFQFFRFLVYQGLRHHAVEQTCTQLLAVSHFALALLGNQLHLGING